MDTETSAMSLKEIAHNLIEAGCVALTYDEKTAKRGMLRLYVYPTYTRQLGGEVVSEPPYPHVRYLLRDVESVTFDSCNYPFWADIDNYGIGSIGMQALYFDESIASDRDQGFSKVTLEEGLTTLTNILPHCK